MPKKTTPKQAMDALLETMGQTYPHADPNYQKPFGEKGTEMDANHTDPVAIPAQDLHTAEDKMQEFCPECGDYRHNMGSCPATKAPVEEEVTEHEFFKEADPTEFEMHRASDIRPAVIVPKQGTYLSPDHKPRLKPTKVEIKNEEDFCWVFHPNYGFFFLAGMDSYHFRFFKGEGKGTPNTEVLPNNLYDDCNRGYAFADHKRKILKVQPSALLTPYLKFVPDQVVAGFKQAFPGYDVFVAGAKMSAAEDKFPKLYRQWQRFYRSVIDRNDRREMWSPFIMDDQQIEDLTRFNKELLACAEERYNQPSLTWRHEHAPKPGPFLVQTDDYDSSLVGVGKKLFNASKDLDQKQYRLALLGVNEAFDEYKTIFLKKATKTAGQYLYHVTHTSKVPSIQERGLLPMQESNWVVTETKERYGEGEIYAFEDANDAVRWAGRMDWEFNKGMGTGKISVVVFKKGKGDKWVVDDNDPMSQFGSNGRWLKHVGMIAADRIVKVVPVTSELIRPVVAGEDVKLAALDPITKLYREFNNCYTDDEYREKNIRNLHKIGYFIKRLKEELEALSAKQGMFGEEPSIWQAKDVLIDAEDMWARSRYPSAVSKVRWAFRTLMAGRKTAADDSRKKQFDVLHRQWIRFRESMGGKKPYTLNYMKGRAPEALEFAKRLQDLKPQGGALFEGAEVSFENVDVGIAQGTDRLEKVIRHIPDLEGEWAHRATYDESQLQWLFEVGISDIGIAFSNLGVEYWSMAAPRDANGRIIHSSEKDASTKSYGAGTPIGGTPNDPDGDDDDEDNPLVITASFDLTAADYKPMFQQLLAVKPDLQDMVNHEISWAKEYLTKQDRITWYLRWARLCLEKKWAGNNPQIKQMLDKDVATYSKKNAITTDAIPNTLTAIQQKLEHWMSLPDKAIQDKIFAYETPQQIAEDLDAIEEKIRERQESERRIVKPREDEENEVFIQFPDGWQWVWLKRAYCPAESEAMGHCGNSPRSDTDDTILSLRQPLQKGGRTYWSPHLTFILDGRHVIGEMKGRNNQKPTRRYHPYIIALLKDQRIKGVKGGGYKPENNFKLRDLTKQQQEEITAANPNIGKAPADIPTIAEGMGMSEGDYNQEHNLFIVREWRDVRRMVNAIGNGEADAAVDWAIDGCGGDRDDSYLLPESDIPHEDDIAEELSKNLSFGAMRAIGRQLEQQDDWLVAAFSQGSALDYTDQETFYNLMRYVGGRGRNTKVWQSIVLAYRHSADIKYRERRVDDLYYLIDSDVYEAGDGIIYTEFRFGKDFSNQIDWKAAPAYEVITYENAQRLLEDDSVDHDISRGQLELYLNEAYYDDHDKDEDGLAGAELLDHWYTVGFPKDEDPDQMAFNFQSSLLKKKAIVEMKETPKFLPQRDDMRRHVDEQTKNEVMQGVNPQAPVQPQKKPSQPKQIDPNLNPTGDPNSIMNDPMLMPTVAALEGEVVRNRGSVRLYAFPPGSIQRGRFGEIVRPAPKGDMWYVGNRNVALEIINDNWGPLTHEQEDSFLTRGCLELPDVYLVATAVDLFADPRRKALQASEPAITEEGWFIPPSTYEENQPDESHEESALRLIYGGDIDADDEEYQRGFSQERLRGGRKRMLEYEHGIRVSFGNREVNIETWTQQEAQKWVGKILRKLPMNIERVIVEWLSPQHGYVHLDRWEAEKKFR